MALRTLSGKHADPRKGRGAGVNPEGRFEQVGRESFDDGWETGADDEQRALKTVITDEPAKSIIARNDSPDIPFTQSINPYQGCEHGCIYCYARPSHAYRNLSPGIDFETRIFAKINAPELLRKELSKPGHKCELIALGANTDPYQPAERSRGITRGILKVCAEFNQPVGIVTKGALVERDIDILGPMAAKGLAEVFVSVTTLDHELARRMEPRCTAPMRRLQVVRALADAGIPVGVMVAPVVPFLNDHEIEAIVAAVGIDQPLFVEAVTPHHAAHGVGDKAFDVLLTIRAPERDLVIRNIRGQFILQAVGIDEQSIVLLFELFHLGEASQAFGISSFLRC